MPAPEVPYMAPRGLVVLYPLLRWKVYRTVGRRRGWGGLCKLLYMAFLLLLCPLRVSLETLEGNPHVHHRCGEDH